MKNKLQFSAALWLAMLFPWAAQASSQLAVDKGCYNCHGAHLRGEAPSFERLAAKLGKYKGDLAAEQKTVNKLLVGETLEHIDAHERLTPASAQVLVHWLVEGAP
jgi:cytochrome c